MSTTTLPRRVEFLVVGGGPVGLTAAISLSKNGFKDIIVVDDNPEENAQNKINSRAITIHAAAMEVSLYDLGSVKSLTLACSV
jgi:2-polyprenyl-6-methoxyphenol hydroxylase-like FAD-dependent oxidoreductase